MHAARPPSAAETLSAAQRRRRHAALAATQAGAMPPSPPLGRQWRQPQSHSPEMRINPPWRRSACDRCRTQKLRCVRAKEDDTSSPCTRCLRIRYPCFTSSAKPPGRGSGRLPPVPAPTTASAEAGSDGAPPANTSASGRRKATVTRRRPSEDVSFAPGQTSPMPMGMGMGWPFSQDEDRNEEAGVFDDGGMFMLPPSEDYQPIDFLDFLVDKDPSGFDSVASVPLDVHLSPRATSLSRSRPVPQALPPLPTFSSASSPSEFLRELDDQPEGAVNISVGEDQARIPSQTPNPPVQNSPGVLLARLLESLSVQLVRLNTEPWDLGVLGVTGSTANSGELDLTAAEALANEAHTFNPLLSILVSTEKLLDICKLFKALERNGGADEASTTTSVAPGSGSRSGSKRRVLSMHEGTESRSTQGAAKRTWRPSSAVSSLPFAFSLPCSSSSSSSSSKRRESCPSFFSVPGPPTGQTTITAAQLLTVVSCYLQVVTIYNDIFSHLLFKLTLPPAPPQAQSSPSTQHLATNMGPIPAGTDVTPISRQRHLHSHHTQQVQPATPSRAPMVHSLVLAGYSVPLNSGLRMRLLVEVVEHQFERIEHALGLPGQYCVSTSHHQQAQQSQQQQQQHRDIGGGQGLLAGPKATTLLEAVMEGADADADGNANVSHDSIGVVASLRESLGKAQRVRRRGD